MKTGMFINLPVQELDQTMRFFTKLGFHFSPQFTDEHVACMVIGEGNFINFMNHDYFHSLTRKRVVNPLTSIASIQSIVVDSKAKVDELVERAVSLGAKYYNRKNELTHMYEWSFEDLDGHVWQIVAININI